MEAVQSKEDKVVYKELSYKIIGIAFEVYNLLGYGYQEKYYQKALEKLFAFHQINFKSQCPYHIIWRGEIIAKNFIDFIIEDKIVLEIKKR
jgi:GxxExxY protein